MDINRNQYFMAGVVFLLLGLQLRLVDSYTLSPAATRALINGNAQAEAPVVQESTLFASQAAPAAVLRKVFRPPEWLGWFLGSIGVVLIMHSLAMKKPD